MNFQHEQFLATTLHEIRTPIQTIIGTLELLGNTVLDKEQLEYVRQIQFSADVMLTLANDVLNYTKLQSGKFKLEKIPFNIQNLTERVVDLIAMEAHNRGLEIVTDIDYSMPRYIMGDPTRIQQILLNLIKNAVKFTDLGYVKVNLSLQKNTNMLLFEVEDSGIGIPDDNKDKIFNDYYQVDASITRKYGGTGLGLSICRILVKIIGGQIGVKDNPAGGSIFWFTIPYDIPTEEDLPSNLQINSINHIDKSKRILLVDDNNIALDSLYKKLKYLGFFDIQKATSGYEALKILKEASKNNNPIDLAFIDMVMPVMDGWRLSNFINNDKSINNTKLYLMVPEGQMGGDAKMKLLDWFNGYLYKPIKRIMLTSVLNDSDVDLLDLEVIEDSSLLENNEKTIDTEIIAPLNNHDVVQKESKKIQEGITCLVVEDHPINQKLIKTFLIDMGCNVFTADDGQIAVDILKESKKNGQTIDIVFMDIQMPNKSGNEASLEFRQLDYTGVIIACTANADKDESDEYLSCGMDDVLVKPFKKNQIQEMLIKWINI